MNSYKKTKSAAKINIFDPLELESKVLKTMKIIADVVGSTLGPSGRPVLIERQEYGMPNIMTKDGVTVFRNLGFKDPVMHAIMESARDAATRTVAQAGDGTTTATVLAYAVANNTSRFCKENPKYTPQKVVREIESFFKEVVEPRIDKWTIRPAGPDEQSQADFKKVLYNVANISANGDEGLAESVMKCFDIAGNEGAITVTEQTGPSGYSVEHLDGFSIEVGFENSLGRYFSLYINDRANNRVLLDKPVFVLSAAPITELQTVQLFFEKIGQAWSDPESVGLSKPFNHNVVLVAPGFSDSVLAGLASNFANSSTINVLPMICQKSPVQNSELHFLQDLAAVTGATVFDPVTKPVEQGSLNDVGYGVKTFEMSRYRSNVIGYCEPDIVFARIDEIKVALTNPESKFDQQILEDRLARLSGGIAKLKISGASNGELREKRDRAEDAIAAVRGAIKKGALPGGGWTLAALSKHNTDSLVFNKVIKPSLLLPLNKLLTNCGLTESETDSLVNEIVSKSGDTMEVYDAMAGKFVNAKESGLLDSTPAVLEAIRNSFSIAGQLGITGAIVVFERDDILERSEASAASHYLESTGISE